MTESPLGSKEPAPTQPSPTSAPTAPRSRLATLAPPPRPVPLALALRLRLGGALGGVGALFLTLGSVMVAVFAQFVSLHDFDDAPVTKGQVLRAERTSAHVNGRPVVAYTFGYRINARSREAVSYADTHPREVGEVVEVEYLVAKPEVARIRGQRISEFESWVLLFLLPIPLLGAALLAFQIHRGGAVVELLRDGRVAYGRLLHATPTGTTINKRRVHAFTFAFDDEAGVTHQTIAHTHLVEHLRDEVMEPLLYHPVDPGRAFLLDSLPGVCRLDAAGRWAAPAGISLALSLAGLSLAALMALLALAALLR